MSTKPVTELSQQRRVQVRWLGGYRTETNVRGVHFVPGDETPQYGGENTGPMPTEMLLMAGGTCMCLAVVHMARKRHISLGQVSVETAALKDEQAFRFNSIQMAVHADLPRDQLEPLINLAHRYCFVSNTLAEGCAIELAAQSTLSVE